MRVDDMLLQVLLVMSVAVRCALLGAHRLVAA
jgi:hypothetical protein